MLILKSTNIYKTGKFKLFIAQFLTIFSSSVKSQVGSPVCQLLKFVNCICIGKNATGEK